MSALWLFACLLVFVAGLAVGRRWGIDDAADYVAELEEGVEGLECGAEGLSQEIRGLKSKS